MLKGLKNILKFGFSTRPNNDLAVDYGPSTVGNLNFTSFP
jgi:hypothetical protein